MRTTRFLPLHLALLLSATSACDSAMSAPSPDDASGTSDAAQQDVIVTDATEASVAEGGGDASPPPDAPPTDSAMDVALDAQSCVEAATRCNGSTPQTCVMGVWQNGASCGAGSICAAGVCTCDGGTCTSTPASCQMGGPGAGYDCAPSGTRDCCGSFEVPGGTFDRSYDGVFYPSKASPATVSGLRLDAYEVTVGRFRAFVGAVVAGWLPSIGSGKHSHLNGGGGLNGGSEGGWDATWTANLATTTTMWNANLACGSATWTPAPGAGEHSPINCVDWYEAYAFCIWDGGFLPSEAEWNYAAAGGGKSDGQRVYPWSVPASSGTIDCSYASFGGMCTPRVHPVGALPNGDGKWGQSDLAGNLWEFTLDGYAAAYGVPCADCANLSVATPKVLRGGGFLNPPDVVIASYRDNEPTALRYYDFGIRCARTP